MVLVNGKILKGNDCPYRSKCGNMKNVACNGDGCPFVEVNSVHDTDFSCAGARFFEMMEKYKDGVQEI